VNGYLDKREVSSGNCEAEEKGEGSSIEVNEAEQKGSNDTHHSGQEHSPKCLLPRHIPTAIQQ